MAKVNTVGGAVVVVVVVVWRLTFVFEPMVCCFGWVGGGVVLLFLYRDGNQCVDEMRGWSRCVGVVDPTGSTV